MKSQNSDTKNNLENKTNISTIFEAGIGRRLFSSIMDAVIFVFVAMLLYLFAFTPIAKVGMNYEGNQVLATQYEIASHLYVYQQVDDDYNFNIIEVKDFTEKLDGSREGRVSPIAQLNIEDYKFYLSHVYYYYTSYLTGKNIELPNDTETRKYDPIKDNFVAPNYDKVIEGKNCYPIEYYTDDWFSENILKIGKDDSLFIRDTSKPNFLDQISVKEGITETDATKELRRCAGNANSHLFDSSYFSDINNSIKWTQIFIIGMSVGISYAIFYVAVPLFYKNGETFAKKFNKLSLVSASGYQVKKRQIVFRQIVLFVELGLSACIIGIGLTSLATLGVGIVILLLCTLLSKTHRAPHDYAAYTLLVDAPKSVWFDSPEAEQKAAKDLDDKMAKYKNKKIIDKKVIQIGDEIISEEFKQEISEKNSKKSK